MPRSHTSKLVLATKDGQGTNLPVEGLSSEIDAAGLAVLRLDGEVNPESIERLFQAAAWMQDVAGARAVVFDLSQSSMKMTWLQWVALADPEGASAQGRIDVPIAFVVKDLKNFDRVRAFGMQTVLGGKGARLPTFETQRAKEWCHEQLARLEPPVQSRATRRPRKFRPPRLVSTTDLSLR